MKRKIRISKGKEFQKGKKISKFPISKGKHLKETLVFKVIILSHVLIIWLILFISI